MTGTNAIGTTSPADVNTGVLPALPPNDTLGIVMTNDDTTALTPLQAIAREAFAVLTIRSRHSLRAFPRSISTMLTA